MRRLFLLLALLATTGLFAQKSSGGYFGRKIIVQGQLAYSPTYLSFKEFFYRWDFQYGGSAGIVTGRYKQVNISWNIWSLGNLPAYDSAFVKADRVKGMDYGISLRRFRKDRGGVAPIGKFFDAGLTYSQARFVADASNPFVTQGMESSLPKNTNQVAAHIAYGTQGLFWNRVIANTGLRFGGPIFTMEESGNIQFSHFTRNRMQTRNYFSVFFGVGILL
jgi:hypothetical protein